MSDKVKQLVSDMYYFASCLCAILIDSEIGFRLYFVTGYLAGAAPPETFAKRALLACRRTGETQKGLQLMLPWGHR